MKHLRIQHYILLVIAFAAAIAACAAYAFMYRAVEKGAQSAADAKQEIDAAGRETLAANGTALVYEETAADRARLPSFFVSTGDAVPFIDAVETISGESGATVAISSIGDSSEGAVPAIAADVAIAGSWSSVMRAVELVEDLPYAVSVNSLSLTAQPAADRSGAAGRNQPPQWSAIVAIAALSTQ